MEAEELERKQEAKYLQDIATLKTGKNFSFIEEAKNKKKACKVLRIDYNNYLEYKKEFEEKDIEELTGYSKEQIDASLKVIFKSKNLLNHIHKKISEDHLGDDNLKMTTFLCCISSLLKNQKLRKSLAIKANTSDGKDNMILSNLKHIPKEAFIFLTSGTQATIEDDIKDKRIIAFSEVNANREVGANQYLVEVIKQKAEGGTSSMKKDIRKGMKVARHDIGEQATVIYGTTETDKDEELGTRFIEGNIKSSYQKIRSVNENTLDTFSDIDKLLKDSNEIDSLIRIGLTYFFKKQEQYGVYIPYAKHLKEQINKQDIFDHHSSRSQRDIKRLLSLTCAMTYLFQEQRNVIEHNGIKILVSEPEDLINTLKFSAEFFNQSYSGLDARLTDILKLVDEYGQNWIPRDYLQEKAEIARNTIKSYCKTLADEGCLEGIKGSELNFEEGVKIYDGNKIYYKRCQKGVKKPLIRCQINELREHLERETKKQIDTFSFTHNSDDDENQKGVKKEGVKLEEDKENEENNPLFEEIDTFSLTPLEEKEKFSSQDLLKSINILKKDNIELLRDNIYKFTPSLKKWEINKLLNQLIEDNEISESEEGLIQIKLSQEVKNEKQ